MEAYKVKTESVSAEGPSTEIMDEVTDANWKWLVLDARKVISAY